MAYVDWMIRGRKIGACNCSYGCPCEFNAPPNYEVCEGLEAMEIEEGWFGDIRLDGLRYAAMFRWPGPVHKGHGTVQAVLDERATEEQLEALGKILGGEEQEPNTVFNVYGSTVETELDPIFGAIEFECDVDKRVGRMRAAGILSLDVEPIRNPVTGEPTRALIRLPEGFEFRDAEVASATFRSTGQIAYDYAGRYSSLWHVGYGPYGIIEEHTLGGRK